MAIDTAEKRRSAGAVLLPTLPGVTPNSDKDQEWRQQSAWSYSGILAGSVVASNQLPKLSFSHGQNPDLSYPYGLTPELSFSYGRDPDLDHSEGKF